MDGILLFLLVLGYVPRKITYDQISDPKEFLTIRFSSIGSWGDFKKIAILWGARRLLLPDRRWYFQCFYWEFWANETLLNQFPKKVAEIETSSSAFKVVMLVFRRDPSMKSLKYLLRYFLRRNVDLSSCDRG